MGTVLYYAIPIGLAAVGIVLLMGLRNMATGGPGSRSNKLMRMRILLQAVALVIIMGALYFADKS